jgi:hypothetical protein
MMVTIKPPSIQAVVRPMVLSERMVTLACAISIDYGEALR